MLISVITVAHNARRTICDTIDSVSAQRYDMVQHVVVDRGATDGTSALMQSRLPETGTLLMAPGHSYARAVNSGLAAARGQIIGVLPPTARYSEAGVLDDVAHAFRDPAVDAVYGDVTIVADDDSSLVLRRWRAGSYDSRRLTRGWMPPSAALFVRRTLVERYGDYDVRYRAAADYDAALRWLAGAGGTRYLSRDLVCQRSCSTGGLIRRASRLITAKREELRALRDNHVGGVGALLLGMASRFPQFVLRPR